MGATTDIPSPVRKMTVPATPSTHAATKPEAPPSIIIGPPKRCVLRQTSWLDSVQGVRIPKVKFGCTWFI